MNAPKHDEAQFWNERYGGPRPAWIDDGPDSELVRVVQGLEHAPKRIVEVGCGAGANAVWMASKGFDVTAFDVSDVAIEQARVRAGEAGVEPKLFAASVGALPPDLGTFDLVVDAYCYGSVRKRDLTADYLDALAALTRSGSQVIVLTGNSFEPVFPGPPGVSEAELREELGSVLELVWLHQFRTEPPKNPFLGWSSLWIRR